MHRVGLVLCTVIFVLSCKKKQPETIHKNSNLEVVDSLLGKETSTKLKTSGVYFKAAGTEPFWGLDISDKSIQLKTMNDTITVPHVLPERAMDANRKRYLAVTEAVVLTVEIAKKTCANAMSGEMFPYTVYIDYSYTGLEDKHNFLGCGYYTTDLKTGCYTYIDEKNSVWFKITDVSDIVSGRLKYSFNEKDKNSGEFRGRLYRDKLIGTYTFLSEGVKSSREVAFFIKDSTLIEGYGSLNEAGTAFVHRDSIKFTSKLPLVKTGCN